MYYQFKKEDAESFQQRTGIYAKERGNELQFQYCPYCHGGKHRDKGSFSINLITGQFECKRASCGVHGNMITLSKDFDFSLGTEYDRYYRREQFTFRKFGEKKISVTDPAVAYLQSRGISKETAERKKHLFFRSLTKTESWCQQSTEKLILILRRIKTKNGLKAIACRCCLEWSNVMILILWLLQRARLILYRLQKQE